VEALGILIKAFLELGAGFCIIWMVSLTAPKVLFGYDMSLGKSAISTQS